VNPGDGKWELLCAKPGVFLSKNGESRKMVNQGRKKRVPKTE